MIYLKLFYEFFIIGLFTFGGGYAMIPLVKDVVLRNGWMDEGIFMDLIGVCEATPGPIAINMATYVGSTQGGFFGSVMATLGVVLPSFIIILLVATILTKLTKNKYFKSLLNGVKPVVIGLILVTGLLLFVKNIGYLDINHFNFDLIPLIIIGIITLIYFVIKLVFKKKLSAIYIILISSVLGIVVCSIFEKF